MNNMAVGDGIALQRPVEGPELRLQVLSEREIRSVVRRPPLQLYGDPNDLRRVSERVVGDRQLVDDGPSLVQDVVVQSATGKLLVKALATS